MKKFNFVTVVLLNIVTFNIYGMYVLYTMEKTNNVFAAEHKLEMLQSFWVGLALALVTCNVYFYVWCFKFMRVQSSVAHASNADMRPTDNAFLLLLLFLVPVYGWYVVCDNYNRTVDANL